MPKKKRTETVQQTAPVQQTEEELKESTRQTALNAKRLIEENYLELAEAIFTIKHREWYRDYGGALTFVDYVKGELDMEVTKAYALTKIWDCIKSLNLPKDRLRELGWSKAAVLAAHATEDNFEDLITRAENESYSEFKGSFSRGSGGGGGGGREGGSTAGSLLLRFVPGTARFDFISQAIASAKPLLETEETEEIIAYVCSEWLQYAGAIPEMVPLERAIPFLERTYGGRFIHQTEADSDDMAAFVEEEPNTEGGVEAPEEEPAAESEDLNLEELDKILT